MRSSRNAYELAVDNFEALIEYTIESTNLDPELLNTFKFNVIFLKMDPKYRQSRSKLKDFKVPLPDDDVPQS